MQTSFGERFDHSLRRWLLLGRRTEGAFATAISVSAGLLAQWRKRREPPTPEKTVAAARELGVDPGWLAYGEASTAQPPVWWGEALPLIQEERRRTQMREAPKPKDGARKGAKRRQKPA